MLIFAIEIKNIIKQLNFKIMGTLKNVQLTSFEWGEVLGALATAIQTHENLAACHTDEEEKILHEMDAENLQYIVREIWAQISEGEEV